MKKKVLGAVAVLLLLAVLAAILPSWNEMWHSFGQNLYHLFH